jgi:hypothetical protein
MATNIYLSVTSAYQQAARRYRDTCLAFDLAVEALLEQEPLVPLPEARRLVARMLAGDEKADASAASVH